MEFINFSEQESKNIEKGLGFTSKSEINPSLIPSDLPVTKTDHYLQDCEEFLDPERTIGTENPYATVVFPNNRTSTHKLFVNQDRIKGISYIHCITNELVHLSNFIQFFKDNGHLYTFNQEKMLARYYHEFLLWSKFQAKKISTRTYTLMMWHEVNGDDPPTDGRYQFEGISIGDHGVHRCLQEIAVCDAVPAIRDLYWTLVGELALYFGSLAFYQQEAHPDQVDEQFPAEQLDKWVGLENVLNFYQLLLSTPDYQTWQEQNKAIRKCVLQMENHCNKTFKNQFDPHK